MARAGSHLAEFIIRECELGKRAAVLFGNEAEGWGPWIDTSRMFAISVDGVHVHSDWLPNPHKPGTKARIPEQRRPSD